MSNISKALDVLEQTKEKQLLYIGVVIRKNDTETIVELGDSEIEASDFCGASEGDIVALLLQNNKFYVIGKK